MKILIFDTETTGLPTERNASYKEPDKWPHIVQLSFILYDTDLMKLVSVHDYIIRIPDNIKITAESQAIHGISPSRCRRKGIPIKIALEEFIECQHAADILVAHNISFDKRVILAACCREKMKPGFFSNGKQKPEYCTMQQTKDIPIVIGENSKGEKFNKYPTLTELHQYLFNGDMPKSQHDALADILICLRCYVQLVNGIDILKEKNGLPRYYRNYAF